LARAPLGAALPELTEPRTTAPATTIAAIGFFEYLNQPAPAGLFMRGLLDS
jgi:hypothetical protein